MHVKHEDVIGYDVSVNQDHSTLCPECFDKSNLDLDDIDELLTEDEMSRSEKEYLRCDECGKIFWG
jgi:uncharacterized protein with PIN domain